MRILPTLLLSSTLILALADAANAQPGKCRDLGGGCAATRQPMLRCSGSPEIGNGSFGLLLTNLGLTFPTGTLMIGSCPQGAPSAFPPPVACAVGCERFVGGEITFFPFRADRFGVAFVPFPIANDPSLVGLRLCAQGARDDGSCTSLSNAVEIRIGRGKGGKKGSSL